MTTTNQTTYKSGTAQQILDTTEPAGTLAFATDTQHMMISNGTGWSINTIDRVEGKSYTTGTFEFSETPIVHVDASSATSMEQKGGATSADGDAVSTWYSQSNGQTFSAPAGKEPEKATIGGNSAVVSSYDQVMGLVDPLITQRNYARSGPTREGSFTIVCVFTPLRNPLHMDLPSDGIGLYEKRHSVSAASHINDIDRCISTSWNGGSPTINNNPWLIPGQESEATSGLGGRYQTGFDVYTVGAHERRLFSTGARCAIAGSDGFKVAYGRVNSTWDTWLFAQTSNNFFNNEDRLNSAQWTRDHYLTPEQDIYGENNIPITWNFNGNFLGRPQVVSFKSNGERTSNSIDQTTDVFRLHTFHVGYNGYANHYDSTGANHGGMAGATTFNGATRTVNKVGQIHTVGSNSTVQLDELALFHGTTESIHENQGHNNTGIHEFIVFPYAMSDAELAAYGAHLEQKWNLSYFTMNCIANHTVSNYDHAGF